MEFACIGTHTAGEWKKWNGTNFDAPNEIVHLATERTPTYVSPRRVIVDLPSAFTPVDVDVDGCGDLYTLTEEAEIYRYDHEKATMRRLPCLWYPEDATGDASENGSRDPVALRVTEDSIYVVDGGIDGVLAFSKHCYQMRWMAHEAFQDPVALIGDARAGYVLDRGSDRGEGFVVTVEAMGVAEEKVITGLEAPTDLAMGANGDIYVLDWQVRDEANGGDDDPTPVVRRFSLVESNGREFTELTQDAIGIPPRYDPRCIEAVTERQILVGVGPETVGETTLYRHLPASESSETGRFARITSFKETCSKLLLQRRETNGHGRGLYAISGTEDETTDEGGGEIYFLDEVRRNRINTETGDYDAHVWRRFDSGIRGVEWHRVTMGLHLGDVGTQVRLRYHATDTSDIGDLEEDLGIDPDHADRLRKAGVSGAWRVVELGHEVLTDLTGVSQDETAAWIARARDRIEVEWAQRETVTSVTNPRDVLLNGAEGRYLWIRMELLGNDSSSPGIDSFRAYFPRQSYLRYLPEIYREDAASAEFLERFLSIFESTFVDIEEDIESVTKYLDARGIPADYLSWLGRWLAIEMDETWPDPVKRTVVRRAPDLFKKRGTREGLLEMLVIYLGESVALPADWKATLKREQERIKELVDRGGLTADEAAEEVKRTTRSTYLLEYSDLDCIDVEAAKRPYVAQLGCPQCFLVLVPPFVNDEQLRAVERIVESQTPAHAVGRAVRLRPWIQLGGDSYPGNTYLGINSVLLEQDFVLEESTLGTDSMLREREEFSQLDIRSKLGTDTVIS